MTQQSKRVALRIEDRKVSVRVEGGKEKHCQLAANTLSERTVGILSRWVSEEQPRLRDPEEFRLFGAHLYSFLLQDDVARAFEVAVGIAEDAQAIVRIEIDIAQSDATLAALPWEFLHTPGDPPMCLSTGTGFTLTRKISDLSISVPSEIDGTPRVLVAVGAPIDNKFVLVERLLAELKAASTDDASAPRFNLDVYPKDPTKREAGLTKLEFLDAIRECKPHILHFAGHGRFDKNVGKLAFVPESPGDDPWVSASELVPLLKDLVDKKGQRVLVPRLVVLHACEGAKTSTTSSLFGPAFGGVAQELLKVNVPCVVAMQFEILNASASKFSREFYARIVDGDPVDSAVQFARRQLYEINMRSRGFATPVLYSQSSDGVLFPQATSRVVRAETSKPPLEARASEPLPDGEVAPDAAVTALGTNLIQIMPSGGGGGP